MPIAPDSGVVVVAAIFFDGADAAGVAVACAIIGATGAAKEFEGAAGVDAVEICAIIGATGATKAGGLVLSLL